MSPSTDITSSNIGFYLDFLKSPFRMVSETYNAQTTITALITLLLVIAVLIAFFFLIYGGIKWITSGGDKEAAAAAQKTITAAIIGLVLAFSAWAILSLVFNFFNVDLFETSAERTRRIYGPYYTGGQ